MKIEQKRTLARGSIDRNKKAEIGGDVGGGDGFGQGRGEVAALADLLQGGVVALDRGSYSQHLGVLQTWFHVREELAFFCMHLPLQFTGRVSLGGYVYCGNNR